MMMKSITQKCASFVCILGTFLLIAVVGSANAVQIRACFHPDTECALQFKSSDAMYQDALDACEGHAGSTLGTCSNTCYTYTYGLGNTCEQYVKSQSAGWDNCDIFTTGLSHQVACVGGADPVGVTFTHCLFRDNTCETQISTTNSPLFEGLQTNCEENAEQHEGGTCSRSRLCWTYPYLVGTGATCASLKHELISCTEINPASYPGYSQQLLCTDNTEISQGLTTTSVVTATTSPFSSSFSSSSLSTTVRPSVSPTPSSPPTSTPTTSPSCDGNVELWFDVGNSVAQCAVRYASLLVPGASVENCVMCAVVLPWLYDVFDKPPPASDLSVEAETLREQLKSVGLFVLANAPSIPCLGSCVRAAADIAIMARVVVPLAVELAAFVSLTQVALLQAAGVIAAYCLFDSWEPIVALIAQYIRCNPDKTNSTAQDNLMLPSFMTKDPSRRRNTNNPSNRRPIAEMRAAVENACDLAQNGPVEGADILNMWCSVLTQELLKETYSQLLAGKSFFDDVQGLSPTGESWFGMSDPDWTTGMAAATSNISDGGTHITSAEIADLNLSRPLLRFGAVGDLPDVGVEAVTQALSWRNSTEGMLAFTNTSSSEREVIDWVDQGLTLPTAPANMNVNTALDALVHNLAKTHPKVCISVVFGTNKSEPSVQITTMCEWDLLDFYIEIYQYESLYVNVCDVSPISTTQYDVGTVMRGDSVTVALNESVNFVGGSYGFKTLQDIPSFKANFAFVGCHLSRYTPPTPTEPISTATGTSIEPTSTTVGIVNVEGSSGSIVSETAIGVGVGLTVVCICITLAVCMYCSSRRREDKTSATATDDNEVSITINTVTIPTAAATTTTTPKLTPQTTSTNNNSEVTGEPLAKEGGWFDVTYL